MPDTMSRTSDWLPNEIARPNTEAPAISGVMLTPSSRQHQQAADDGDGEPAMTRSSGIRVRSRDAADLARRPRHRPRQSADGSGLAAM